MAIRILRNGSSGPDVERWQNFLVGQGHMRASVDGQFGPKTEAASKKFQRAAGLVADGIVGPRTFGAALLEGFDAGFADPDRKKTAPALLAGDPDLKPTTQAQREKLFGKFAFKAAPTPRNREAIEITDGWDKENIVTVMLPELQGISVFGKPSSGRMRFHRKAADQLQAMWAAWGKAGLIGHVLTYDGSFNARFIRGSREVLSNHAFGSAFDINAKWNPLGTIPAQAGSEGSVRELVDIANKHGFFWGGHFRNRPDGMHFEVAKIL